MKKILNINIVILCILQGGKVCSEKSISVQATKSNNFQHSDPFNQITIIPLNQDTSYNFISHISSENRNTFLKSTSTMLHNNQPKRRQLSLRYSKKMCAHHKSSVTKLYKNRNKRNKKKEIEKKTLAFRRPGCGRRHCQEDK